MVRNVEATISNMNDLTTLLALVAEVEDENEVAIEFTDATWSGGSLELELRVTVSDIPPELWQVHCTNVLAYSLSSEGAFWLELTEDHPLLWEYKHLNAMAFFAGAPRNPAAAVGDLYEAHRRTVGSWLRFGDNLNAELEPSQLLSTGNGLLARGPLPLLTLYKDALRPHGVEVNICSTRPPTFWDGSVSREVRPEDDLKALLIGSSYVVGTGLTARRSLLTKP